MRILLRSLFTSNPEDKVDLFNINYNAMFKTDFSFPIDEHQTIWEYIKGFFSAFGHVPNDSVITSHFIEERQSHLADQIELIKVDKPLTGGNFQVYLNKKIEKKRLEKAHQALIEANGILVDGRKIGKGKDEKLLIGPRDAFRYVVEQAHEILTPVGSRKLSGEAHSDVQDYMKEYEARKNDMMLGRGQYTGIMQMDKALKGAKRGELWTHAAFTGHLKSTFSLNWAYNQAIVYGQSVCYFSLEMPYDQCRRNYYAMHTRHWKFNEVRMKLGIQELEADEQGIDYQKIRDSELSPEEEEFFLEYVLPDLEDPDQDYGKVHFEVADPNKTNFTVPDLKAKAEMIYSQQPFSMIMVDHALLVAARGRHNSRTDSANEVIRDLKKLAMNFFQGEGIPVVVLFQMNRQGYSKAKEKDGLYDLTALSYSNEVERSSDVITASWYDGAFRDEHVVLFQNLKTRDLEPFKPFIARIDWKPKRILTLKKDYNEFMNEETRERVVRETEDSTIDDLDFV